MKEIEALLTENGVWHVVQPNVSEELAATEDECSIKHLGKQIYEVKFFDEYKGDSLSHKQNKVNSKIIYFPSDIKRIIFK
jgi:hypothetical protein